MATDGGCAFHDVEPPFRSTAPASVLALIGFVGLCLLVGAAGAGTITGPRMAWYLSLSPPPGTPSRGLIGPIWAGLYVLIGIAGWLVWRRIGGSAMLRRPLRLWGWQLLANALWAPAFFGLHNVGAGLAVMAVLAVLVLVTLRDFARVDRAAAGLFVPYAIWVTYLVYVSAGFWWLNGV